ncbi:MAG: hypothetical protein ACI97A_002406 [Planctomycetota bacterium]|jgi:hypothetical protein
MLLRATALVGCWQVMFGYSLDVSSVIAELNGPCVNRCLVR